MTTSRVLIIGATGRLGQNLVRTSIESGRPTFALVRGSSFSNPEKSALLEEFTRAGVQLLKGSLEDVSSLVEAVGQVDAVICAVSSNQVEDQKLLIQAIKRVGSVKRFIPAEFGTDPDRVQTKGLEHDFYKKKAEIRRIIEREGIPHTYISCNFFMSYLLPSLVQPGFKTPPRDRVKIFGDGNTKAVFVRECDVASFTISTLDDPRTLNKVLYLRPPGNIFSLNELVEMWEMKIGKKLEKVCVPQVEVLRIIEETSNPNDLEMYFIHAAFIKGVQTYFKVEDYGVEGTQLYPHIKYTTISQYLDSVL
ncbi:hypothetical protein QJS10_CPA03g00320 [Acorus calamus]|uniref:NmrA-like domain-containing protein n=1 Tax=Acorus calamus TaxID=4465 RepID=A0AAV9F621_ACOCL|nr:hypothetical protein QJS10_CPA03g00320 [Acorus calamus]